MELKIISEYIPKYHSKEAAGFDLECVESAKIYPGETKLIDLGCKMQLPKDYYLMIVPRSSIYKRGLFLSNSIGIIDSDYRGPIKGIFTNYTNKLVRISKGDRLVQGVLCPVFRAKFVKVDKLSESERGMGGFGSTDTTVEGTDNNSKGGKE